MSSATADPLCSNLLRGMHAAAQPLAILRARFYKEHIESMNKGELRELALSSTAQIERLCTLFSYLQQLVFAECMEPKTSVAQVSSVLEGAIDSVDLWFHDSGMLLGSEVEATCNPVLIDKQRTQQALSAVLMIAQSLSQKGDRIQLTASPILDTVQVAVRNVTSTADTLSSEGSLGMAVAEAHMRSQGGNFTYSLNPLLIKLDLPQASLPN